MVSLPCVAAVPPDMQAPLYMSMSGYGVVKPSVNVSRKATTWFSSASVKPRLPTVMSRLFGTSGSGQQVPFQRCLTDSVRKSRQELIYVARIVEVYELFQALDIAIVKKTPSGNRAPAPRCFRTSEAPWPHYGPKMSCICPSEAGAYCVQFEFGLAPRRNRFAGKFPIRDLCRRSRRISCKSEGNLEWSDNRKRLWDSRAGRRLAEPKTGEQRRRGRDATALLSVCVEARAVPLPPGGTNCNWLALEKIVAGNLVGNSADWSSAWRSSRRPGRPSKRQIRRESADIW